MVPDGMYNTQNPCVVCDVSSVLSCAFFLCQGATVAKLLVVLRSALVVNEECGMAGKQSA